VHFNFVLAETFGLVFAESNAVGTPVLTHDCGAAREVISDSRQILPVSTSQQAYERAARMLPLNWRRASARYGMRLGIFEPYVERIRAWREGGRPKTGPDARFKFSTVIERWRTLLGCADTRAGETSSPWGSELQMSHRKFARLGASSPHR
jgi:glycosyltransferase involved in cell wall biosynthesis